MDPVISDIRKTLLEMKDDEIAERGKRFFKEEIQAYGLKTADVGKIAKKYWKTVKNRRKADIFQMCESLYQSGYMEEAFIVSSWMADYSSCFSPEDLSTFKYWIQTYITNWAACDGFCNHAMGDFFVTYPEKIPELISWTQSSNRWMRRASAVSLIIPAKKGKFLDEVFQISDSLLTDTDDMVQKGYGWLLKEASRIHQDEIFSYVMEKKKDMPRTSLRYAIELMPPERRTEAMKKDWK